MPDRTMERRHRGHVRRPLLWAATLALALSPWCAHAAEEANFIDDSFYVALATFVVNTDTKLRLDGSAGEEGTPVNWEDTFGSGDVNRFRFDGHWRFGNRHKLRAMVFSSSRTETRSLQRDIEWGDTIYPAQASATGKLRFSIYELAYEYAFLRKESYEISGTFGLHYTELKATLSANASIEGDQVIEGEVSRTGSFGAPLPVVGARGIFRLPANLWLDASVQFFAASIDEYDGNIQDYRIALNWQPSRWVGLGAGYNEFVVDVDVNKPRFRGNVNWKYRGPMIFYSVSF